MFRSTKSFRPRLATWSMVFLLVFLAGCADLYQARGSRVVLPSENASIAVVPFENLTNHQGAGVVCAEMTQSELAARGRFRMVSQGKVRRIMETMDVKDPDRIKMTQAEAIGEAVHADLVVVGNVSEYGYQYGLREEPSVTLSLRLVRLSDGAVLWHASAGQVGRGTFSRESVSLVAMTLIRKMVSAMLRGQDIAILDDSGAGT
ncbi:MAG: GNA1162 family protein [Alphaproteobacteria bacterium]